MANALVVLNAAVPGSNYGGIAFNGNVLQNYIIAILNAIGSTFKLPRSKSSKTVSSMSIKNVLYVFVEIGIDITHLVDTIVFNMKLD